MRHVPTVPRSSPEPQAATPGPPLRVLVVDDDGRPIGVSAEDVAAARKRAGSG